MPGPLRYQNPELQNLLAANYVTGTLRGRARDRMESLMRVDSTLAQRVREWEDKLQPLHNATPVLPPKQNTWKNIAEAINGVTDPLVESLKKKLNFYRYFSGFALSCAFVLAMVAWLPVIDSAPAALNYVAVMKDSEAQPTIVVTLSKEGRRMALDMLIKPTINSGENLQLWAISKEDGSIASLGSVDVEKHAEKSLTKPQWGLIKNAEYLIVSVEKEATVTLPSNRIISKGLCVKVEGWQS